MAVGKMVVVDGTSRRPKGFQVVVVVVVVLDVLVVVVEVLSRVVTEMSVATLVENSVVVLVAVV